MIDGLIEQENNRNQKDVALRVLTSNGFLFK
jgi:hypothetical protein